MKKIIYKISTILILIIFLAGITRMHSKVFASSVTPNKIMEYAENFLKKGETDTSGNKFEEDDIIDMIKSIYQILLVLGIVAAVIIGLILSIKFITGGLEEQAKIKEMLVPYVVGCIVIFTAFTIWQIVVNILQDV